jgi:prepilin-type N-terminal cleavage/methylation domain-containing protein
MAAGLQELRVGHEIKLSYDKETFAILGFDMVMKTKTRHRDQGFSLIELLIVVAIILIVAAIAIPNLMRARMSAHESSAAASIRTISTAEVSYASTFPTVGYTALGSLGGATPCTPSITTGCFVDSVLSSGTKEGYNFTVTPGGASGGINTSYTSLASPVALNGSGSRSFCGDQSGVIYFNPNALTCNGTNNVLQ